MKRNENRIGLWTILLPGAILGGLLLLLRRVLRYYYV